MFCKNIKYKNSDEIVTFFDLPREIIKYICIIIFGFIRNSIRDTLLDGHHDSVLVNWLKRNLFLCASNNDIPIKTNYLFYWLIETFFVIVI